MRTMRLVLHIGGPSLGVLRKNPTIWGWWMSRVSCNYCQVLRAYGQTPWHFPAEVGGAWARLLQRVQIHEHYRELEGGSCFLACCFSLISKHKP